MNKSLHHGHPEWKSFQFRISVWGEDSKILDEISFDVSSEILD